MLTHESPMTAIAPHPTLRVFHRILTATTAVLILAGIGLCLWFCFKLWTPYVFRTDRYLEHIAPYLRLTGTWAVAFVANVVALRRVERALNRSAE